jgi:hypothetical protein
MFSPHFFPRLFFETTMGIYTTTRYLIGFCLFKWVVWLKNLLSQGVVGREQSIAKVEVITAEKVPHQLKKCPQHSSMERRTLIYRMKLEENRLKSFKYWTCPYVFAIDLAREGFFYFNQADFVQCIFCFGILSNWESTDTVEREHEKHFPYCPRVLNLKTENIPLILEYRHHSLYIPPPYEHVARLFPQNRIGVDEPDR